MSHIPIPGTTQHKLIQAGLKRFAEMGYNQAEVDDIAADAGVTVGALYHHYKSKKKFYGLLRDDVTLRILDRMEAVADAAPPELRLKLVLLTAYDSMIRLKVGRLLSEPDPRKGDNPLLVISVNWPQHQEKRLAKDWASFWRRHCVPHLRKSWNTTAMRLR